MPAAETFFDTKILLYLLSEDAAKADRMEELIANGGVISVQVLNEFAAVAATTHPARVMNVVSFDCSAIENLRAAQP
jgi:predicted nucleic acid-binding protein